MDKKQVLIQKPHTLHTILTPKTVDYSLQDAIIEERNRELAALKSDYVEVNKLFKIVGEEIAKQGEQVDNIENNISRAQDNVKAAGKEIVLAEKELDSTNKLYLWIAGGVGTAGVVAGAVVASLLLL